MAKMMRKVSLEMDREWCDDFSLSVCCWICFGYLSFLFPSFPLPINPPDVRQEGLQEDDVQEEVINLSFMME